MEIVGGREAGADGDQPLPAPAYHDEEATMIYPMFALVLLTFFVGIRLGSCRFANARSGRVDGRYYRLMRGDTPPDGELKLARNFSNLFEAPVLFYVFGAIVIAKNLTAPLPLALAWSYVALRAVHTAIHLGRNHPVHRFLAFLASCIVLLAMWGWLALVL
ncbi:MAPEG family protein [Chromobacterium sp. CV08]|uniref:MAPEG family protein n=1 Tax=Chromobacterium sp. CV08 TaxID=3133274 RepID=UPI003DA9806E